MQLEEAGLNNYSLFLTCIYRYSRIALNSYRLLQESPYLHSLHIIRLLVDSIYTIYGLSLANTPDTYLSHFFEDKPTNQLKHKSEKLTTNVIGNYAKEDYEGIDVIYSESCRYLHPSIFMRISKEDIPDKLKGILTIPSIWGVRGGNNRRVLLEFIIESLNYILYDVQLLVYNRAIVPLHSELEPIRWKRDKGNTQLTKEAFRKWLQYQ